MDITNVPVPPAYWRSSSRHLQITAAHQQEEFSMRGEMSPHYIPANEVHTEDMEMDSGGGVNLANVGTATHSASTEPPLLQLSDDHYYQKQLGDLSEGAFLYWSLPLAPARTHVSAKLKKMYPNQPCALHYHKSAALISKHWHIDPDAAVPKSLRDRTPYSLVMLIQLRRLASHTKGDYQLAQELLLAAQSWHPPRYPELVETFNALTTIRADNIQYCEPKIWEHSQGLMLEDVMEATRQAMKLKKCAPKGPKPWKGGVNAAVNPQTGEVEDRLARRAAKRQGRQERQATKGHAALQALSRDRILTDASQPVTQPTFNLPIRQSRSLATTSKVWKKGDPTLADPTGDEEEEVVLVPRRSDRQAEALLSKSLGAFRLNTTQPNDQTPYQTFLDQRESKGVLPMELAKTNWDVMRPLHESERTSADALAAMGQQPLLQGGGCCQASKG